MDFDLSEDQRLLQDSISKLLKDKYGFEQRKAIMKSGEGWSREIWNAYAELGLLGMPFAEADGGLGYGAVETMIVAEQLGRALALEPFITTVVMGGGFLRHGATAAQRAELVPQIAEGKLLLAFAPKCAVRFDLHDVATPRRRMAAAMCSGAQGSLVLGDTADRLIVSARGLGGKRRVHMGFAVFLVPADAKGVTRRGLQVLRRASARRTSPSTAVRVGADALLGGGMGWSIGWLDVSMAALPPRLRLHGGGEGPDGRL